MSTETMERPSTTAKVKFVRMSASKARVVLNLIRNKTSAEAFKTLSLSERRAAEPIRKCLNSAVANAEHNNEISVDELYISACFADEGPTLKRFRPRARGRAGRIHKQTCHITIEVSRLSDDELDMLRKKQESSAKKSNKSKSRSARVAKSKKADGVEDQAPAEVEETVDSIENEQEVSTETSEEAVVKEEVAVSDSEETEAPAEEPASEDTEEETK